MLRGMCELSRNDTKNALATFTNAYYIQERLGSPKGICETRIHLAAALLMNGDNHLSLNTLLLLKQSAEEYNLPYYLAQAYRHLGEFFLHSGETSKATPLLDEAREIFQEHSHVLDFEQVRNLEAISAGLELLPNYIMLLSGYEKPGYMAKMIDWKDLRKPFWEGRSDDNLLSRKLSVDEIIEESKMETEKVRRGRLFGGTTTAKKSVAINENPDIVVVGDEHSSDDLGDGLSENVYLSGK
ncbi:hypothetical protein NQ318_011698 [Aromia moschata]|uniref:Tetratricopeptide repeat protein 29 n=1 Tax=Aromia moschata TaxID=1265417 RepID=A0AAV8XJD4_9CUCU|nr:hypothetical protein NQ318_011698 [Aromia moschata]